jgi:hypothetical protein
VLTYEFSEQPREEESQNIHEDDEPLQQHSKQTGFRKMHQLVPRLHPFYWEDACIELDA